MPNTFVLIDNKTLSSNQNTVEFTSIPATYTDLMVKVSARSTRGSLGDVVIRFNNSSSNLVNARFYGQMGGSPSASANSSEWTNCTSDGSATNTFSNIDYYIPEYASSKYKTWSVDNVAEGSGTNAFITLGAGVWENTAAINTIQIRDVSDANANNLKSGSTFHLYGILKA